MTDTDEIGPFCWADPGEGCRPRFLVDRDGRVLGAIRIPDEENYAYSVQMFGDAPIRYYIDLKPAIAYAELAAADMVKREGMGGAIAHLEARLNQLRNECAALDEHAAAVKQWLEQSPNVVLFVPVNQ